MSSEWSSLSLEVAPVSILDGDRGTNYPSQDDFLSTGHCLFLNTGNVTTGGFNFSNCAFVSAEKDNALRKGKLVRGDIVLTTRGTVGNVGLFNERIPFDHVRINSGMVILRPEQEKLSSYFLYLFLRSDLFKEQANSLRSGSAQPQLPIRDLKCVEITVPPIKDQNEICSFLGALDDRITLLRETNTTLEAIAQALFKSWFVDFDPVHAKQEGREPEGMDADTAALFPDSFEELELGLVPKGWRVGKVETVLSRLPAKIRYTKDQISSDGATPVYEQGAGILLGYHEGNAQYQANENDPAFIFGDHTCVTHLSCEPFDISQNVIPLKGKDRATLWVYYAIKDKQTFQEYRRHWMELIVKDIVIPTAQICDAFAKYVSSYHLKMESNVHHSRTLTTLRDTLLPRLISGQLRLPDAEAMVEEV